VLGTVIVVAVVVAVVGVVALFVTRSIFMNYNNKNIYLLFMASFLKRNLREG
jgi:di/tricarboxylate transporter